MFHNLTLAVRDRMIRELKDYWADHPRYEELSSFIQGKYSFEERPQFGMVVKTSGATNVVLSPDNFIGTLKGYVSLAKVVEKKGVSFEWVKENPSIKPEAGVYHFQVQDNPFDPDPNAFQVVYQRYVRRDEPSLLFTDDTHIELNYVPVENSLRIVEAPSGRSLTLDEYSIEGSTITLTEALPRGLSLSAYYTSKDEFLVGPFMVKPDTAYHEIIPGVVIAVGRWIEVGDELVVIVEDTQQVVAHEYGGRWDVSVDIELIARDAHSQADIADRTVVWMWSTLRGKLANLGMSLNDVSLGGESEEVYDENGDDYFYMASISATIQTDWFIHFPLVSPIKGIGMDIKEIEGPVVGIGSSPSFIQRLL